MDESEQQKDSMERSKAFFEEYGKLREKYQCDFYSYPVSVPTEQGFFNTKIETKIADLKALAVKSPIVMEE